ncbi:MAG TPA: hypothetical protein VKB20_06105, partial [Steroidobacteraceae bacterium]|nr:hypothetical protein [Steroidobacteraceae bacterium]
LAVDVGSDTHVGGLVFFDVSNISLQNEDKTGKKVDTPPNGFGFDIKRFYLIVDHKFNDVWSANLTTDAQYSTATTTTVVTPPPAGSTSTGTVNALTGQNTSGGVTEVMIKKLYLQGKFSPAFNVRAGAYDSPWAPFVESLYGYRYIEKTTTDRLGFANTADWGFNVGGAAGDHDLLSYSLSAINGGGYKNPTRTKYVDFEGRVGVKPVPWLTAGLGYYTGHLGQVNATNQDFPTNTASRYDAVIGVILGGLRVGGEYFEAKNYKTVKDLASSAYGTSSIVTSSGKAPVDDKADGFSAWASYAFAETQWSVFARYDEAKLSKDVAPDLKDKYFNVGIAYKPIKELDFALVYKKEKVDNGSNSVSAGNANGSILIGGATAAYNGTYDEVGVFARWGF